MSSISRIAWRNKDVRQLKRLVDSYNKAIDKQAEREPENAKFLPQKTTYATERQNIVTRKDFDYKLKSLQNIFKPNALKVVTPSGGFTISNYEIDEGKRLSKRREAKKSAERKRLLSDDEFDRSKITDLGLNPKEYDINRFASKKAFEKFVESAERQLNAITNEEKLRSYRENYVKGIEQLGVSKEELNQKIKHLSDEQLFDLTSGDDDLRIKFYYEEQDSEALSERILGRFDEVLPEEVKALIEAELNPIE